MAIKVNGTTVIDDSRNFTNINSGFKTVNGTSVVGSGDISAGASTTYGAVGTYILGAEDNGEYTENTTLAGSTLYIGGFTTSSDSISFDGSGGAMRLVRGGSQSGTWRRMNRSNYGGTDFHGGIYVRIS